MTGEVSHQTPTCKVPSAVIPWMIVINMIMGSRIAIMKVILQELGTDVNCLLQDPPSGMGLHLIRWIIVTWIEVTHLMISVHLIQGQGTCIMNPRPEQCWQDNSLQHTDLS